MLRAGLIDEVRQLKKKYQLNADLPSMRAVGYRQAWSFLEGALDEKGLREHGIAATRQLAKRQGTWLRSFPDLLRLDAGGPEGAAETFNRLLHERR
jgi:tRNA dimethylallyltransferase